MIAKIIDKVFSALGIHTKGDLVVVNKIDVDDGYGILCRDDYRKYILLRQFSQSLLTYDEMVMQLTDGSDVAGWVHDGGETNCDIDSCFVKIDGNAYCVGIVR